MGLLTTVDDARLKLEEIFKNNIDKPNNPWTSTKVIVLEFHWLVKSDKLCYTINILSQVYGKEKIRALCK
jgi:hypothetical protein